MPEGTPYLDPGDMARHLAGPLQNRTTMRTSALLLAGLLCARALAQTPTAADSTGLPGDNFSLQGAMELFKNAKDLEAFEKALNTSDSKVNNLDLDGDGKVDYVRVVDVGEGDVHAVVLRVPMSKTESQDVAVIEIEKTGERSARALIRGDALLYGDSVLLEPTAEVMKQDAGRGGPDLGAAYPVHVWINVWGWPCVNWMYGPSYMWWDSPWYWGYYPTWYRPWRPWGWNSWWGYSYHYNSWCRPVYYHAPTHASTIYAPRRSMSTRVATDTRPVREARANSGARSPLLRDDRSAVQRQDAVRSNDRRVNSERTEIQRSTDRNPGTREAVRPGPGTNGREVQRGSQRPDVQRSTEQRGRQGGQTTQPRQQRDRSVSPQPRQNREARPSTAPSRSPSRSTAPSRSPAPSRSSPGRGR